MSSFEQQLKVQSEQIKTTHSEVDEINEGMTRASKQVHMIDIYIHTYIFDIFDIYTYIYKNNTYTYVYIFIYIYV